LTDVNPRKTRYLKQTQEYRTAVKTLAIVLIASLALTAGCAIKFHKPTTAGNAGTTALVAYGIAGAGVADYLALPLCHTPPVYPCKTQVINDRLVVANRAAYQAAIAADEAAGGGNTAIKADKANEALKKAASEAKTASTGGN
jgi:hypothetical protein